MKTRLLLIALLLASAVGAQDLSKCAVVKIETNYGSMTVALYNETPLHRDNFLKLAKSNFYDGVLFHRVIREFMIQAGDPMSKDSTYVGRLGEGDLGYKIPAEINFPTFYHKKGALAAARQGDNVNPERSSSACQFYIVEGRTCTDNDLNELERRLQVMYGDPTFHYTDEQRLFYKSFGGTPHLDGGYTVFGEVTKGFEVIDKISAVETDENDRPTEPVKILGVTVVKNWKK